MERLITVDELCERWGVSRPTIYDRIKRGDLTPVKTVPGTKFRPEVIDKAEGVEYAPLSPSERRKLEQQVKKLQKKNAVLRQRLARITAIVFEEGE